MPADTDTAPRRARATRSVAANCRQWFILNWLLKQANVGDVFLEHRGELTYHVQYPLALLIGLPLVLLASVGIFVLQRRNLKSSPVSLVLALTVCRTFSRARLVAVLAGPFVKLETARENRP